MIMERFARATLLSGLSVLALAASPAAAQQGGTSVPPPLSDEQIEQQAASGQVIIVTGTRRTDRTLAESPVPIDVIAGDALVTSGATEVNRILNQLVPSFNFPQPSITDGTDVLRPATLRGLSPDQTLVLVNGKRRHTSALLNMNGSVGRGSAAVDLNTIPPLAIERIEVLRDGASSQYGSDALAGVINVQLRRQPGGRAQVTYGRYDTTLRGVAEVSGVQRAANGEPVVLFGTGANEVFALTETGRDRRAKDGDTTTLAIHYGVGFAGTGYLNLTGEMRDRSPTNRSGYDPRRQYPLVGGRSDPREFGFNRINHRYGDAATEDYNLFANAGIEFSPGIELYAFGSYGSRKGESAGFYRRAIDPRNRNFSASATTFVPFYPDGFLPLITSDIKDMSAALGLRGEAAGWNWDISHVYGSNRFDFGVANSFNTSFGANSQTRFDAGGLRFGQHVTNLDIQRNLEVGFLHELSLAVGAEHRRENFKIVAGELQSYAAGPFAAAPFNAPAGAQVFPGFRPANEVDASRNSWAGYAELDADITRYLTVQLAGRYEHFSDFGDTLNGKVAARLAPVEWFSLRGSVSTGFRAPSLHQQFYATTATNNIAGVGLVEIGTFPVASPVARALGARDLEPEKSVNLGVGATISPLRGLSLTADYYKVSIDNRIVVTENLQGAAVVALLQQAGFNNITSARFFINGIDTETEGLDIVGTYRLPNIGMGSIALTAGYNRNETKITDRAVLPTLPGLTLFGRLESLRIEQGQPRDKINVGLDWDYDLLGFTLRSNRYGTVLAPAATAVDDVTLEPRWITDAEVRLSFHPAFQLAVGANNLFDQYPTRLPPGPGARVNNYFLPYSSFSPFGFNGRFVYFRVSSQF
jgi:iron complex outermembrane recepter protein